MVLYGEELVSPDRNTRTECAGCGMFASQHRMTRVGEGRGTRFYCEARECQAHAQLTKDQLAQASLQRHHHRKAAETLDKVIEQAVAKIAGKQKTKMVVSGKEKVRA